MMDVRYIDHMGDDDRIVDAARVSFARQAAQFGEDQNTRLLGYLARNGHWSPFAHCLLTIHVKAPIYVARQLAKHQVGLAWNEVSRRYVDDEPAFAEPELWRERAADKKQGSGGPIADQGLAADIYTAATAQALDAYEALLDAGVAPEQARMVLPQATLTEWYWTGSLAAFARVHAQRVGYGAQAETTLVALRIGEICEAFFPRAWAALTADP